jgi:hypothetical protein
MLAEESCHAGSILFISSIVLNIKKDPFGMTGECYLPNEFPSGRERWIQKDPS